MGAFGKVSRKMDELGMCRAQGCVYILSLRSAGLLIVRLNSVFIHQISNCSTGPKQWLRIEIPGFRKRDARQPTRRIFIVPSYVSGLDCFASNEEDGSSNLSEGATIFPFLA